MFNYYSTSCPKSFNTRQTLKLIIDYAVVILEQQVLNINVNMECKFINNANQLIARSITNLIHHFFIYKLVTSLINSCISNRLTL